MTKENSKNLGVDNSRFGNFLKYLLIVGGVLGVLASFALTIDKINLLSDPTFKPACNLNPIISCGSVIASEQAEAFGFPNPIIGLVGFTAVAMVGVSLIAGANFKRWFWLSLNSGLLFGTLFAHWLIYQSLYEIGNLCPFCMLVWIVTIALFWYVTLYNLRRKFIKTPKSLQKVTGFAQKHHADILFTWYLIIILAITERFWYYWKTLL